MDNYTLLLEETFHSSIMSIKGCCSTVLAWLPDHALPFLPSLILGMLIASAVLIYLMHKETKEPLFDVVRDFVEQLFALSPSLLQEAEKLKSKELRGKATVRWQASKYKQSSTRLKLSMKSYTDDSVHNDDTLSVHFNVQDLSSFPWWKESSAFDHEKALLETNFTKIKAEFQKAFKDFQKGVCKQWQKVDIKNGHSCSYPLISGGIINTLNCSCCPSTFKVLHECRALGLTGCAFGSASFTLLYPDSNVSYPPSSNVVARCFLVLQHTTPGHLEVDGIQERWQEGQVHVFSPCYPHSMVLSDSRSMNVVSTPLALLSVDLWHPSLDMKERADLSELFCQ